MTDAANNPRQPYPARDAATKIVRVLRDAGHVAYFAGGCVRDRLLGLEPSDYDVATDAPPEVVTRLFRNSKLVGEAFGVALVRLMGHEVEVATFRIEWGYEDGRRPSKVEFTDAEHDARRRDFTINGIFEDPFPDDPAKAIIDYVGGREDLRAGVIRAIGEPDERFGEDYLRLLRAVRFAARFGFTIEERTARAIRFHAKSLSEISRERIGLEVQAMLAPADGANARRRALAARLMQELTLDGPVLNESHASPPLPTLEELSPSAGFPAALAAWMLDRHLPGVSVDLPRGVAASGGPLRATLEVFNAQHLDALVKRWRKALCLSNDDREALQGICLLLPRVLAWPELGVAARKRLLSERLWKEALAVTRALSHHAGVPEVLAVIDRQSPPLIELGVSPPPLLTGDDLIALGRKPGPAFRRLLDAVYDAQLEGSVRNRDQALAWLDRHAV